MVYVNKKGVEHAESLIKDGKVDLDSSWSFTTEDENEILGDGNWNEYEKWFLAIDTEANEETKARYMFPYGKKGKVYRRGVIAAKQRASQYNYKNIMEVADMLLKMIDEKYLDKQTEPVRKVYKGKVTTVDEESATLEAVVSDETIDRYNEVILSSAWTKGLGNYKKHPILLSSHNYYDLKSQIGYADRVWLDGKQLHCKFKYFINEGNEQADWGFNLAKKGLAAFSVGFIPKKYTENEEEIRELLGYTNKTKGIPNRVYTEVELLEISQVLIPANPSALVKDYDDPVAKSIADMLSKDTDDSTKDTDLVLLMFEISNKLDILLEKMELVENALNKDFKLNGTGFNEDIVSEIKKIKSILKKSNVALAT